MRLAMAQPCLGSRERVFRIRTSRAPWMRLLGLLIRKPWLSTIADNLQYGCAARLSRADGLMGRTHHAVLPILLLCMYSGWSGFEAVTIEVGGVWKDLTDNP